ncbi:MAG: energy-coupled thiamine transporter ThiT [Coriobacteriia bacterium]
MKVSRVRLSVEIGLTVALAAVLSLFALWEMPQGGSVSLAMLPLFVIALLRGPWAGLAAGALYGVIDFFVDPYVFHPLGMALDYPIAYALCGLAGVFAHRWASEHAAGRIARGLLTAIVPGIVFGALGRYAVHVLSGVVFFASFADDAGQAPLVYSAVYNSFVLVSAVGCALIAFPLMPQLQRLYGGARG